MPKLATQLRPAFLVTIDTEGDNQWGRGSTIETKNAGFLPRFQSLCEKYGVRPTWLTNWEMAIAPEYQAFARDVLARGTGEIGMHLHAWNCPPETPLTEDDYRHHPYLIEYPEPLMREKIKVMTDTLEDVFGVKMVSHRAGRFSFNEIYARALIDHGYLVDGSVTPGISWKDYPGNPKGNGGTDFRDFPAMPYFLDANDIRKAGNSSLLEIPVTVAAPHFGAPIRWFKRACSPTRFTTRVARHFFPDKAWLYPKGNNHPYLTRLLDTVLHNGGDCAEFMIHSSELMPAGSPRFPDAPSIERLYGAMETLFAHAARHFVPATMKDYYDRFTAAHPHAGATAKTMVAA